MRVFVTGSGGVLGRNVVKHIHALVPSVELIRNNADLTNLDEICNLISSLGQLDIVIHLAALVPVSDVNSNPARAYQVNVGGTVNLLDALKSQSPRFVYCSSGHVYGSSETPVTEEDHIAPLSLYGRTKWLGELATQDISSIQGLSTCIARVFSIHDPNQKGSFLRPTIEKRLKEEDLSKPFELYGANSLRDFLTANEAARRLVLLALSEAQGPVNVGSGKGTRVGDFVQSLTDLNLEIKPMGKPDNLVADISRLRHFLKDDEI